MTLIATIYAGKHYLCFRVENLHILTGVPYELGIIKSVRSQGANNPRFF